MAGPSQKAKEFVSQGNSRSLSLQASGCVTAYVEDLLVQVQVSTVLSAACLWVLGRASGRVDVPDGAWIEAAAAFAGTLRSRPGKLDALRSVRSREGKVQFSLKECVMIIIRFMMWWIMMVGTFLLQWLGNILSVEIALRRGVGQCGEIAAGVVRLDRTILQLLLLGMLERIKGRNKGPSGRDPLPGPNNVPPTVSREPQVVPPRGPPGAGVGTLPQAADSPAASEDLLKSGQASSGSHVCGGLLQE